MGSARWGGRRQRLWRVGALVLVPALVVFLVWWGRTWLIAAPGQGSELARAAAGRLAGEGLAPSAAKRPALALTPPPAPASEAQTKASGLASPEDHCGLGLPRGAHPVDERTLKKAEDAASAQARQALLQALAASADLEAQAVGLFLRRTPFDRSAPECSEPDSLACQRSIDRKLNMEAVRQRDDFEPLQSLLVLAERSDSALVQGLVWQACQASADATLTACQQLSVARWAELEPDNALPWLALASERSRMGDLAGQENALHRAVMSRYLDSGSRALMRLTLVHMPPGVQGTPRLDTTARVLGLAGVVAISGRWLQTLMAYCPVAAQADANRLHSCREIADLLAQKGETLAQRRFGQIIAKRMGTEIDPASAVSRLLAFSQRQGVADDDRLSVMDRTTASGCAEIEQMSERLAALGILGDAEYWQRRMAKGENPR